MSHGTTDAPESVFPTSQTALNKIANGEHLKQKRARSQLSCIPCRQGKLKCNRSHDPACDQCVKRSREGQCHYVPPPKKQKATQNVKGRIRQLETLVVDLMNQQNQKDTSGQARKSATQISSARTSSVGSKTGPVDQLTPPSDNDHSSPQDGSQRGEEVHDDVDSTTKPFGKLRISKGEVSYVGETHWQAILNGISDLKRELGEEQDDESEQLDADLATQTWRDAFVANPMDSAEARDACMEQRTMSLGLMLGGGGKVTREQLIKAVPEKRVADRLCALWFNSPDPMKPFIHAPTFQDQYRTFWRDPKDTPTMWLGLLFGIMSLAASFGLRDADPKSDAAKQILADVTLYHTMAGSAAVLADYTKGTAHTMECLMLYGAGIRSSDASVNVWLLLGLIVRLGLRMGYHRDPIHHPGISAFEGEMRRRVWAGISMIDVLFSFQLGLPGMVRTIQSDTQPPSNLLDRDFNVNTTVLPAGRGIDELTPSSYVRAKLKLVSVFADVNELIHATVPPCHGQMMELDRRLEEAKASLPPLLQMPDLSETVTDPAEQLMCRYNLDLLYLKTKMVLHRRYMEQPFSQLPLQEQEFGIGFSRKACVDAALKVLRHHHAIYAASQPGGQLESVKWYMGSISTHDFLLAAMVVCLELSQQISSLAPVLHPNAMMCPLRGGMMDALEKSHKIWSETANRKPGHDTIYRGGDGQMIDETDKACRAMSVMLAKVRIKFPQQADALRQANLNRPPERPGMGIVSNELGIDYSEPLQIGAKTAIMTQTPNVMPFGGIVSFHAWNNVDSSESLEYQGQSVTDTLARWSVRTTTESSPSETTLDPKSSASISQPTSNEPTPNSIDYPTLPDFSMIGDMLDMPGSIDWEIFDAGVTKFPDPGSVDLEMENIVPGNVLYAGGTGPGPMDGSALMGYQAGQWLDGEGNETRNFPGSNLRFADMDMDAAAGFEYGQGMMG